MLGRDTTGTHVQSPTLVV